MFETMKTESKHSQIGISLADSLQMLSFKRLICPRRTSVT